MWIRDNGKAEASQAEVTKLADLLRQTGEFAQARPLLEEVVAGRTAQLGAGHIQTLEAQWNLGTLLRNMKELCNLLCSPTLH